MADWILQLIISLLFSRPRWMRFHDGVFNSQGRNGVSDTDRLLRFMPLSVELPRVFQRYNIQVERQSNTKRTPKQREDFSYKKKSLLIWETFIHSSSLLQFSLISYGRMHRSIRSMLLVPSMLHVIQRHFVAYHLEEDRWRYSHIQHTHIQKRKMEEKKRALLPLRNQTKRGVSPPLSTISQRAWVAYWLVKTTHIPPSRFFQQKNAS